MRHFFSIILFVIAGISFLQGQVDPELLKNMKFRNVGPAGMSGRVASIDVDPTNANRIFAGAASGGLWLSENGGQSWACIFNNEMAASIGVVKVDPSNPSVIWVGTGEGNPRNSQTSGNGIFKSVDGGKNWMHLGLEATKNIHRITIDPRNSDVVYVGAIGVAWGESENRGVYKSTDGGKTWNKILYVNEKTGVADMVMDPKNPNKLLVAMWEYRRWPWFFNSGGEGSGLYVTHDGGENWEQRTDEDGLPKGNLGRIGLAIAPSAPNVVYALIETAAKNGLYKSIDGGFKWRKVSENEQIGNRPFYYSDIYVSPDNPNKIFSLWSVMTVSEDGGKSWKTAATYNDVHPDHQSFWIGNDPNYIIEGNDGGLNISRDGGQTWRFVENLPLAQFYHIRVDNDLPYNIYGGMQDNGSWRGPGYVFHSGGIRNSDWTELYFGDGFDVMPDPENNRYVYAMSQEGYVAYVDSKTGNTRSVRPVHPDGTRLRFNWNAAIAQDPFHPATLYFGSQFVHKSTNRGLDWEIISPDLTTNDTAHQKQLESGGLTYDVTGAENYTTLISIAPSKLEQGLIWVGSDDGKLHLTKDGGDHWEDLSSKLKGVTEGAWIPQIHVSNHHAGEAFVVVNDYRRNDWKPYLFYTADYGKTFTQLVNEETVTGYTMSVVQDPVQENLLFLGTKYGLYVSFDKGQNWQHWGKDFPTVQVSDMAIQEREADLVVGTFGRSAWVLDDIRPLREIANTENKIEEAPLTMFAVPSAIHASWKQADGTRFAAAAIYKGDNRTSSARLSFWLNEQKEDTAFSKETKVKIEIIDRESEVIRTLYRKFENGLNRTNWNLTEKGPRWPSMSEPKKDKQKSDPSGRAVLPGHYTVRISYGSARDSATIQVGLDPRVDVTAAEFKANYDFKAQIGRNMEAMNKVAENLREAKSEIGLLEQQLTNKEGDEWKAPKEKVKAVKDSLEQVRLAIFGKENTKGYYEQPDTWTSVMGLTYALVAGNSGKYGSRDEWMVKQLNEKTKAMVERSNKFLLEDWKAFTTYFEENPISLFKAKQQVKLDQN